MRNLLPLNEMDLAVKPDWATHYFKGERDYVLFESKDFFQWCCFGELKHLNPQGAGGINEASRPIKASAHA